MKTYEKMLIAIQDEEFNCYASKGSWLNIANKKDTKKGLFRLLIRAPFNGQFIKKVPCS